MKSKNQLWNMLIWWKNFNLKANKTHIFRNIALSDFNSCMCNVNILYVFGMYIWCDYSGYSLDVLPWYVPKMDIPLGMYYVYTSYGCSAMYMICTSLIRT